MKSDKKILAGVIAVALTAAPFSMALAGGGGLFSGVLGGLAGKLLTGVGGVLAVKLIAGPLNTVINDVMLANHVQNQDKTKVVPIVSVGSGIAVGAAQVTGPQSVVDQVQAVGAIDIQWNNGVWQGQILVPIDSLNPLKGFKRVYGVGVDAVLTGKL